MRRLRVKAIAGQRFLSKRTSKRISKILAECNNIGKIIEDFVFEHGIGADAWCHMGVLTFDGNTCLPQKVTYERIRLHLQEVYKRHFSYGTVVQLCVARNKRRLSSKVTTRRARKGFTLKYNPDAHWSAAFYKGLNSIQLVDGQDMCLINRDNPAGYADDLQTVCYTNCERQWNLDHQNRLRGQICLHIANHIVQFYWHSKYNGNMCRSCEGSSDNSPEEPLPTCNWPCNARAAGGTTASISASRDWYPKISRLHTGRQCLWRGTILLNRKTSFQE